LISPWQALMRRWLRTQSKTTSDSSMPMGMSRCGLCDSCAATDTASKPM